jgi:hypothetical protein
VAARAAVLVVRLQVHARIAEHEHSVCAAIRADADATAVLACLQSQSASPTARSAVEKITLEIDARAAASRESGAARPLALSSVADRAARARRAAAAAVVAVSLQLGTHVAAAIALTGGTLARAALALGERRAKLVASAAIEVVGAGIDAGVVAVDLASGTGDDVLARPVDAELPALADDPAPTAIVIRPEAYALTLARHQSGRQLALSVGALELARADDAATLLIGLSIARGHHRRVGRSRGVRR